MYSSVLQSKAYFSLLHAIGLAIVLSLITAFSANPDEPLSPPSPFSHPAPADSLFAMTHLAFGCFSDKYGPSGKTSVTNLLRKQIFAQ
jgi:hypothetical protein